MPTKTIRVGDLVEIETNRLGHHSLRPGTTLKTSGVVICCVGLAGDRIWVLRADNGCEDFFFENELKKIETDQEENNED